MVKAEAQFPAKLKAVNARLSRCKLVQHSGRLYLRSSHFPLKPGSTNSRPEYPTGFRANLTELRFAEGVAVQIDGQLLRERFDWADWLKSQEAPAKTCLEWVQKLEKDYWQRRDRTPNTENTWRKSYQQYYKSLAADAEITESLLIDTLIERYKAGSRSRQLCAVAFGMLAEFAGLSRAKIAALGQGYRPESKSLKSLPTDEQIEYAIDNCQRRDIQIMAGLQATFGLRNHEIFRLNRDQISEGVIAVTENSKTGAREVYAYPFDWVQRWTLWEDSLPILNLEASNNYLGSRVSQWYKANDLHRPYQYRDAWILRLRIKGGIDRGVSAIWAGHSPEVEDRSYFSAIQDRHHKEVFERLRQG